MTNHLFFTIIKESKQITFTSDQYTFTIKDSEQQVGTNGKARGYYHFDRPDLDLKGVSWNHNHNATKSGEYLLIDIKGTLHSGFINKSKTQENVYYCKLEPLPPRNNFEIIY